MNLRQSLLGLVWLALAPAAAWAVDLAKIDRTILKEPAYQTKEVKYCLLVFGPEAKTRVWLVQDGGTLYVDRNGNGDLTDPGEKVAATPGDYTDPKEGIYEFKLGNVADGPLLHKQLRLSVAKLDSLATGEPVVKDYLARHPDARAYRLGADVEMPGRTGSGLGGRLLQTAGNRDVNGVLRFGGTPADAPVLHFRGGLAGFIPPPPPP